MTPSSRPCTGRRGHVRCDARCNEADGEVVATRVIELTGGRDPTGDTGRHPLPKRGRLTHHTAMPQIPARGGLTPSRTAVSPSARVAGATGRSLSHRLGVPLTAAPCRRQVWTRMARTCSSLPPLSYILIVGVGNGSGARNARAADAIYRVERPFSRNPPRGLEKLEHIIGTAGDSPRGAA